MTAVLQPGSSAAFCSTGHTLFGTTGVKPLAVVPCGDHSSVCKSGLAVNFGRLKSHRGRFCVRKFAKMKQDTNISDYDEPIVDGLPEPQPLKEQNILDIVRRRSLSSRNLRGKGVMNEEKFTVKSGDSQLSKATKFNESDAQDISVPRVRVASRRGWGNGDPIRDVQFKSKGTVKQSHKFDANSAFFSRRSFSELGCNDYMIESLRSQLILRPSHVQALAFATVLAGKSCIIADQSGSGKTFAYLLPLIQRLRQEELEGLGESLPQSPRVIILVPTAELASQVLSNCRAISKSGVPFRSIAVTGGFRQKTQQESLQRNTDVLIATPGRFMFLIKEGVLQLTNLRCAVLDEVDILFNQEDYEPALQILINSSPVTTQYLFVTATLPLDIYNKLVEVFPDCEVIMGPGMHRTSPELEEILVDCSGDDGMEKSPDTAFSNKRAALLQLAEESPVAKTIIFCNKIETCRKVENVLSRLDRKGTQRKVLPFHAALAHESRLANFEEFCNYQLKDKSLFLVCTDRASRGIDFSGVDHIVLFDFPRDPSEYVRRVGRTARGPRGKGKAFIFVVGKQVPLARRIIERNRKGHPLHDVPAAF